MQKPYKNCSKNGTLRTFVNKQALRNSCELLRQTDFIELNASLSRLKTGNRTRFIELLFHICFEIWSFIHTMVKIYTYKKMGRLHTGIIIHYIYYIFFQ